MFRKSLAPKTTKPLLKKIYSVPKTAYMDYILEGYRAPRGYQPEKTYHPNSARWFLVRFGVAFKESSRPVPKEAKPDPDFRQRPGFIQITTKAGKTECWAPTENNKSFYRRK